MPQTSPPKQRPGGAGDIWSPPNHPGHAAGGGAGGVPRSHPAPAAAGLVSMLGLCGSSAIFIHLRNVEFEWFISINHQLKKLCAPRAADN